MSWVKNCVPKGKEDLLAYHLHRVAAHMEGPRPASRIHASDVTKDDYCPREVALYQVLKLKRPDELIGTATSLVWAQGAALATYVIALASRAGVAVGDWRCNQCLLEVRCSKCPEACPKCERRNTFEYREIRVTSLDTGISCGLDLLAQLPQRKKLLLFELKSIGKDEFKALKMPMAEHRLRTNLYLRSVAESDYPFRELIDTDEARVLYVSKGGYGEKSSKPKEWGLRDQPYIPFKEFTVARCDKDTEKVAALGRGLRNWMQGGGFPEGVCSTGICDRAQRCKVVSPCFSGKYPVAK